MPPEQFKQLMEVLDRIAKALEKQNERPYDVGGEEFLDNDPRP